MAPIRLFVTGITGYIGSATMDLLFQEPDARTRYTVRALVRSQEKAERDIRPFGVEPVIGSLEDSDLLTQEVSQADVVLHFADTDHMPAIKAILKGLEHRPRRHDAARKRPILIHTSGTGMLLDNAHGNYASKTIYYDNDLDHLNSLPDTQPHRNVDLEIMNPSLADKMNSYIVAPCAIWGDGVGPGSHTSIQIPYQVRFSIKNKQALQMGKGINIWSIVHILDLADFYVTLFHRSLQEPDEGEVRPDWKPLPRNGEGHYFVEDGEYALGDVAKVIAREFKAHGINDSGEVLRIDTANALQYLDRQGDFLLGGNSRGRAVKARELFGWKPEHTDVEGHIVDEVRHQLASSLINSDRDVALLEIHSRNGSACERLWYLRGPGDQFLCRGVHREQLLRPNRPQQSVDEHP
ncbi:hypothetical protein BGZ98_007269, partial [Dissophora globulifera]